MAKLKFLKHLPPACSPRVGIVAHMQANMALEILLGKMPYNKKKQE
jgi:hypothetical protein